MAQQHRCPVWVCGQTGAHDHLIFMAPLVIDAQGDIVGDAPAFAPHLLVSSIEETS